MSSKVKNIIIVVVIAAALILAYVFLFNKNSNETNLTSTSGVSSLPNVNSNQNVPVDTEFLSVLLGIKNIKLNDSIFSDVAFKNLNDSSITLVPDNNEGRKNPFANIGLDPASTPTQPAQTQTPTIAPAPASSSQPQSPTPAPTSPKSSGSLKQT
jgi:hypothetical protein